MPSFPAFRNKIKIKVSANLTYFVSVSLALTLIFNFKSLGTCKKTNQLRHTNLILVGESNPNISRYYQIYLENICFNDDAWIIKFMCIKNNIQPVI